MASPKVIVVGGGAAGLMAAGQAGMAGASVLLLEKMKKTGRKICITGKGRCNITNIAGIPEFISHFGKTGKFLHQSFARFFNNDLLAFFEKLGLETVTERGGRVFPANGKAPDVSRTLLRWVRENQVEIRPSSVVSKLLTRNNRITGVIADGITVPGEAVILATGGASYPATGSTGDGYRLAADAGHRIIPIRPALVGLETAGNITGRMAGLDLRNVTVKMLVDSKKKREAFGEISFTKTGVSGPVILTLSSEVVDLLARGREISLTIDLKPALDEQKLDARLQRDLDARSKERLDSLLRGILPREMIPVCLQQTGLAPDRPGHSVKAKERRQLNTWLKNFRLEITGHRPLAEAIVTAGGVETKEIDPRTMESRLIKGLYLAGELLDIQGDTGGYNLQAAFSTGWLAGRSAAGLKN